VVWEVVEGAQAGRRFEFDRHDTLLVGRCPTAQLCLLDDPHFSRNHLLLEVNPPHALVRDLGSTNGTFVNGKRVTEAVLRHGDIVSGGRTRIRFSVVGGGELETVAIPRPTQANQPAGNLPLVDGYEILRRLAQGGMGVVYLARQQATGKEVALKLIVPESAANELAMRRFLREASVLSQLDHKRIVRFHELGLSQGRFFFAMEYVEAIDLMAELRQRDDASRIKTACGIICQALEGLSYAHERSFVHRDIKPGNILVGRQEGRLRAKIADFGLAKNFEGAGFSGMTCVGQAVGTVAFMAPEQIRHCREAKPAVDIYAAGATLYWLLCENFVYHFPKGRDPLAVILEDEPVPLLKRSFVPAGLSEVVQRSLAKDPAERFPSAPAMWKALAPYATGEAFSKPP
jgi:serine/threonine-protein kinase